ncbi:hypothetical protein Dimus_034906 [Dionaea muscipula]
MGSNSTFFPTSSITAYTEKSKTQKPPTRQKWHESLYFRYKPTKIQRTKVMKSKKHKKKILNCCKEPDNCKLVVVSLLGLPVILFDVLEHEETGVGQLLNVGDVVILRHIDTKHRPSHEGQ